MLTSSTYGKKPVHIRYLETNSEEMKENDHFAITVTSLSNRITELPTENEEKAYFTTTQQLIVHPSDINPITDCTIIKEEPAAKFICLLYYLQINSFKNAFEYIYGLVTDKKNIDSDSNDFLLMIIRYSFENFCIFKNDKDELEQQYQEDITLETEYIELKYLLTNVAKMTITPLEKENKDFISRFCLPKFHPNLRGKEGIINNYNDDMANLKKTKSNTDFIVLNAIVDYIGDKLPKKYAISTILSIIYKDNMVNEIIPSLISDIDLDTINKFKNYLTYMNIIAYAMGPDFFTTYIDDADKMFQQSSFSFIDDGLLEMKHSEGFSANISTVAFNLENSRAKIKSKINLKVVDSIIWCCIVEASELGDLLAINRILKIDLFNSGHMVINDDTISRYMTKFAEEQFDAETLLNWYDILVTNDDELNDEIKLDRTLIDRRITQLKGMLSDAEVVQPSNPCIIS